MENSVWFVSAVTDPVFIKKDLPGNISLVAETWNEPDYPGIRISLRVPGCNDEVICFAEYNSAKPEGKELCIAVYSSNHDEPVYYESYSDPQPPSPNT